MTALFLGDWRRRLLQDQVEAGPQRRQLAAQLMADVSEDRPDVGLIQGRRGNPLALGDVRNLGASGRP